MPQDKLDKNSRQTIIAVNIILSVFLLVKIIVLKVSYEILHTTASLSLYQYGQKNYEVDMTLAIFGAVLLISFTFVTLFLKKASFLLIYSSEVSLLCLGISYPYYCQDSDTFLRFQCSTFHIATLFSISFQTTFIQQYTIKQLIKHLPLILIYLFNQAYVIWRSQSSFLLNHYSARNFVIFLTCSMVVSTSIGISSLILQKRRHNSFLRKKDKAKRLKLDYQNVIENFAQGVLITNK